jgi:subtilase family serine protease
MRTQGLRNLLRALLAVSASFLPAFAQAPSPAVIQTLNPQSVQADRIPASADLASRVRLSGHVPAWTARETDLGPVPAGTQLHLIFSLSRSAQRQAAFDQLLADQQNPSSPRYHQWLTPQQVGTQYGPTQNDLAAITSWLSSQGFHVDSIEPSGLFIHASAPTAVASAALQVSLHNYTHLSRTLQEPTSEPSLPAGLTQVVSFIAGLGEVDYRTHLRQSAPLLNTQTNLRNTHPDLGSATPAASAPSAPLPDFDLGNNNFVVAPADFAVIYDLNSAYNAGITGSSERVAIIGGSRLLASDLSYFQSISGIPSSQPNYIVPSCNGCSDPGITKDDNEAEGTLDFDRVSATATGASVDQIISFNWLNGTVTAELILYAINTVNDPILTMSFGACEAEQTSSYLAYENSVFSQAASQGISVFASSGDAGVDGCEGAGATPAVTQTASISDICGSPYVTCVGGTEFNDASNYAAYWSAANNRSNAESALSYIPEGAWNEPTATNSSNQTVYEVASTGGGFSTVQAKPYWQVGTGVPADGARDVPDVSFSGAGHDGYFGCFSTGGGSCIPNAQGQYYLSVFSGTSATAPAMAAVAAMLDQKLGARQGNLNPILYKVAASTSTAFHDATPASSGVASCSTAIPSMCNNSDAAPSSLTGGLAGYALTTGYDLATGLGSLDVSAFLTAASAVPTLAATTSTLTAAPTTITSGQSAVFTSVISSGTAGTPTGTVQFSINGSPYGTSVTLAGGQAASPAILFTTPGTFTITAGYSGDSIYAASTRTISFLVTGTSPTPTYSLTAAAPSLTLASGSSARGTDVITAATTSGFTGAISFTCSVALTSGAAAAVAPTCSLSPASATITSPATSVSTTAIIATVAPHALASRSSDLRLLERVGTLSFAGLLLFTLPLTRRRSRWTVFAAAILLSGALAGLSGCGSSSSSTGGGGTTLTGGTTTGAYTVTVTGSNTSGNPASTTFALTVN